MRAAALLAALIAVAGPALGQDGSALAPTSAPPPVARPAPEADGAGEGGDATATPPPEPVTPEGVSPPDTPANSSNAEESPPPPDAAPPIRETLAESPDALAACLDELRGLHVAFEREASLVDAADRDCGIANPLRVTRFGDVAVDPPAQLRCEAAVAAARWMAETVQPAARRLPGRGRVVGIAQGTGYLCRPRVGDDGARLSEHAFGNALDVAGFRFEQGEPLKVEGLAGQGSLDEAFVAAVRGGACLDFTTVLGPGANAEHEDHLHLDVRAREGGFRICQ